MKPKQNPSQDVSSPGRRKLLKFAGALGLARVMKPRESEAQTWQKIGSTTVGSGPRLPDRTQHRLQVLANGMGFLSGIAIRTDGKVFTSGANPLGTLGDNTVLAKSSFIQALGISNARGVSSGQNVTMAIRSDGFLFTCGSNATGQLGLNSTTDSHTFSQAIGVSNVAAVSGGLDHIIASRADGFVFACGGNSFGQLGNNTITNVSTFVQVPDFPT